MQELLEKLVKPGWDKADHYRRNANKIPKYSVEEEMEKKFTRGEREIFYRCYEEQVDEPRDFRNLNEGELKVAAYNLVKSCAYDSAKFLRLVQHPGYQESYHFRQVVAFAKSLILNPAFRLRSYRQQYQEKYGMLPQRTVAVGRNQNKRTTNLHAKKPSDSYVVEQETNKQFDDFEKEKMEVEVELEAERNMSVPGLCSEPYEERPSKRQKVSDKELSPPKDSDKKEKPREANQKNHDKKSPRNDKRVGELRVYAN